MKAAFLSELAIVRTFVLSFIGILAFVFVFIYWTMRAQRAPPQSCAP